MERNVNRTGSLPARQERLAGRIDQAAQLLDEAAAQALAEIDQAAVIQQEGSVPTTLQAARRALLEWAQRMRRQ